MVAIIVLILVPVIVGAGLEKEVNKKSISPGRRAKSLIKTAVSKQQVDEEKKYQDAVSDSGKLQESVTTSYAFSGDKRDEKNQLNLEIGQRKPGRYEIVILIHDEVSGEKAKRIVPFTISK